jgi:hypothetical protein
LPPVIVKGKEHPEFVSRGHRRECGFTTMKDLIYLKAMPKFHHYSFGNIC